ncbi:hypothetical protein U1Q18_008059 [Sarracenia purpurea var. burkii]
MFGVATSGIEGKGFFAKSGEEDFGSKRVRGFWFICSGVKKTARARKERDWTSCSLTSLSWSSGDNRRKKEEQWHSVEVVGDFGGIEGWSGFAGLTEEDA